MIKKIKHSIRLAKSRVRERLKSSRRSPKWDETRDNYLKKNPSCEACGYTKSLQVHHIIPFKKDPTLELQESNLITLCMGPEECHINLGHADSFSYYNPTVDRDAELYRYSPLEVRERILKNAKANRIKS